MLKRSEKNPLIKPADVKPSALGYQVVGAFNPGAIAYKDEIILLLRLAEKCVPREGVIRVPVFRFENGRGIPEVREFKPDDPDVKLKDTRGVVYKGQDYLSSISHIRLARSRDGIHFTVEDTPFIAPGGPDEKYGVEDARAVCIEGEYYINYTIISEDSWCTALSKTADFKSHQKVGIIFHPENKDVAIFPERVNGMFTAFHRPNNSGFGKAGIWYAESPDLLHWGNHRCLLRPRDTVYEAMKIGGGSSPIKTREGWLTIYHAKGENSRYSLFGLLLDLNEPWKIVRQGTVPLFEPEASYETDGFFGNVVFTNGMVEKDGRLYIYYGAADEFACLAFTTVDDILNSLLRNAD